MIRSERVFANGIHPVKRGNPLGALTKLGQRIRLRHLPWALFDVPGLGLVMVICVHMPPRRMVRSGLYALYAATVRRLARKAKRKGWHAVALGDWNQQRDEDPADMVATFGGEFVGARIDLAWVSPSLLPHVAKVTTGPLHHDDHRTIWVRLGKLLTVVSTNLNFGTPLDVQLDTVHALLVKDFGSSTVLCAQEVRF
jgi:endonuclease/exonuclease/phosphatase family metal-dependent hydrolase